MQMKLRGRGVGVYQLALYIATSRFNLAAKEYEIGALFFLDGEKRK